MILNLRTCLCLLICLVGGREARPDEAQDRGRLEGTWSFVSTSRDGEAKKDRDLGGVVFQGDTITFPAADPKKTVRGTFTVDSSKSPKTMDITLDRGGKKTVMLAIYELDGDTLKLCHFLGQIAAKERPTELAADKRTVLGILKRETK